MPETKPVGNFRRSTAIAIIATLVVIAGFVGLRLMSVTSQPVPTLVAGVASPTPTITDAATATPAPTPPPQTASPAVSSSPMPHPTDGLASVSVYSTADFERAFVSRQYVGTTMLVRGRIVAAADQWPGAVDEQSRLLCDSEPRCVYGQLDGATVNGGTRPLLVWSRVIETPLGTDDRYDGYWWPSRARVPLPVEGVLVLHIDTTYSVEFVGRALVDAAGAAWTPASVAAMEIGQFGLDEVVLVDGWLTALQGPVCPETDHEPPLSRSDCGNWAWLASDANGPSGPTAEVQRGALEEYGDKTGSEPTGPVYGLWAIGPRLALGGSCPDIACPGWHVLAGALSEQVDLGQLAGLPTPTPISTDGWIAVPGDSLRTTWSPDGRWLLDWRGDTIFLIDPRTGVETRSWRYVEDTYGRGPWWLDETTFVAAPMPTSDAQLHDGLAPAKLGRISSARLVDVEVPVGHEDGDLLIAGVAGRGAIAFITSNGSWRYRVWTPAGISRPHRGMPIAWSPAGDRLAVIHERSESAGRQHGMGAGWAGYSGSLEVVKWPGLRTVYSDPDVIAHEDAVFDPTGRRLALANWPLGWVDLRAGETHHTDARQVYGGEPIWNAAGDLMGTDGDGAVVALDQDGGISGRWPGVGHHLVGTADGRVQVAWLSDPARGTAFGVFTAIFEDGTSTSFELPAPPQRAFIFVPAVLPDGRTLIVHVIDYDSGHATLMLHPLVPPAD